MEGGRENNVGLCEFDRALWQWSKEQGNASM
jgi:hypothetical protein